MDLQGFSNRDKSIINANPEANPYELKELGLSEKGFNRLLEGVAGEETSNGTSEQEGDDIKENEGEAGKPAIVKSDVEPGNRGKEVLPENVVKVEVEHVGVKQPVQANSDGQIITQLTVSACIVENLKTGKRTRMSVNAAKTLSTKEFKIVDYVN